MRELLQSKVNWSSVGWSWLWALALLALPVCSLPHHSPFNLPRGSVPLATAIFCDIERPPPPTGRPCATAMDISLGIPLASAAVALAANQQSDIGLDYSPDALARCGGQPEKVVFHGWFPRGYPVCLNCAEAIGTSSVPDVNAACVKQCEDFFGTTERDGTITPNNPPHPEDVAFCQSHARASTNTPLNACYTNACTDAGRTRFDFDDPRLHPEPVNWQHQIGVFAVGGSLTRNTPSTGWDAGAASGPMQRIESGDGYVEFTATEVDKARVCGLSDGATPEAGPGFADIGFGIDLFSNGNVYIVESGAPMANPVATYATGDKFRVKVKDNLDSAHTASITYVRVTGVCNDGMRCHEEPLYTSLITTAPYPFRVDASLFDQGATLTAVGVVRIHQ